MPIHSAFINKIADSKLVIFTYNEQFKITSANDTFESQWESSTLKAILHSDDTPLLPLLTSAQKEITLKLKTKTDAYRFISFEIITNGNGEFCAIGTDITTFKIEVSKARLQETLLRQVLDNLPMAVACKNVKDDFSYMYLNHKAEELWNTKSDAILGKTDRELFGEEEGELNIRHCKEIIEHKIKIETKEVTIKTSLGEKHLTIHKIPVYNSSSDPLLMIEAHVDTTEIFNADVIAEFEQARALQASKMATLSEMAGGIAHEINNPLTVIHGVAGRLEIAAERNNFNSDLIKKSSEKLIKNSERIASIIKGLRSFARDASHDPIEKSSVKEIINSTAEFCKTRFNNHSTTLKLAEIAEDITIDCRVIEISQALLNLLNNALEAVEKSPNAWVEVSVNNDDKNFLEISVTDSGNGIPEELQHKISQPFFTTKALGKGTGLGLSIVTGILKSHHGDLVYDAKYPNTRFTMRIPKIHSDSNTSPEQTAA